MEMWNEHIPVEFIIIDKKKVLNWALINLEQKKKLKNLQIWTNQLV